MMDASPVAQEIGQFEIIRKNTKKVRERKKADIFKRKNSTIIDVTE